MYKNYTFKLSIMMFLEFFIWGSWFVTMGTFVANALSGTGVQIGLSYQTQSIGAMVAPFFIGLIADRYFPAQIILGILHILGGVFMLLMAYSGTFSTFYPYLLVYMLLYMPTLALVNSVSFNVMSDTSKQFSTVRVFGTIGWVVAGLIIGFAQWESTNMLSYTFILAALSSFTLGVFSFFLPHTPPKDKGKGFSIGDVLGLKTLALLKDKSFLVFVISSILICIPLSFYYSFLNPFLNELNISRVASLQSLGQVSEIIFMLLLPFFLLRVGIKKTILFGMFAWLVRYVLFAYGNNGSLFSFLLLGILLHGICYDFFFVTGQIYTDKKADKNLKSSAQGFITFCTYGLGMFVGTYLSGIIVDKYTINGVHEWQTIWLFPAILCSGILILFFLFFKDKDEKNWNKKP